MTERKPPGTSWETWIDAQIRLAGEQGAFDNLPGAGKPLPNLGQDPDWWVKQLVKREQISILPPSLELLRKVETELAAIEKLHDEATVRRRVAALNVEIANVNATLQAPFAQPFPTEESFPLFSPYSPTTATSVIVIDPQNKPHKTTVMTGIRDSGMVQITDGLESGQRVVTTGAFELAKLLFEAGQDRQRG